MPFNIFIVLISLNISCINAMDNIESDSFNVTELKKFFSENSPTREEENELGYNPKIKFYPSINNKIINQRPSLFIHGWGSSGETAAHQTEKNKGLS